MKTLREFMNEEYSRACLMVTVENETPIRELQKYIPMEILSPDEDEENGDIINGVQMHLHTTVLYGLESNLNTNELLPFIEKYRNAVLHFRNIEHFENDLNVCVLRIDSDIEQLHHEIRENFKVNLTFKEYKPHLTLAYLKKGKFFEHNLVPFQLRVKDFVFSNKEGSHKIL